MRLSKREQSSRNFAHNGLTKSWLPIPRAARSGAGPGLQSLAPSGPKTGGVSNGCGDSDPGLRCSAGAAPLNPGLPPPPPSGGLINKSLSLIQRVSTSVLRSELTPTPLPLSPAPGARFTGSEHGGAGERGQRGCCFYPGRRADALALGYNPSPFQG